MRANAKQCVLAINYGMGARSLAQNIQQQPIYARDLIHRHRRAYPQFWRWSNAIEHFALSYNKLWTCYGWYQHFGPGAKKINSRSIRNFPVQGNASEMLHLACIWATEAGLTICCPIHDALLLESPLETLDRDTKHLREIMAEASLKVLQGFEVKTDVEVVRYPNRYHDERGKTLWDTVMNYLTTQKLKVSRFGT